MATINTTWDPCGPSSDGQFLYYGKTTIVTGTPISGTGWNLYSGAALSNVTGSASITGLDDNVEYSLYNYCHCTTSGNGPLTNIGPYIKYVCPTVSSITPTFNGLSYTVSIPGSANNAGTWIKFVLVQVVDSGGNVILTNSYNSPFTSTINDSFNGLNPNTSYNIRTAYENISGNRFNVCSSTPFTTAVACTAPVASVSNITANTFDVSWTPSTGGSFDVILNGTPVATGLTSTNGVYTVTGLNSATIYQVAIRKNCTTGGSAISNTLNVTTSTALINGVISMNSNQSAVGSFTDGNLSLIFSFPTATTAPITLYFGYTREASCNTCVGSKCNISNGYDIFSIPSGAQNCPAFPTGDTVSGLPNSPFVVNIPQGVTTYNSGTNIIPTTGSGVPAHPWLNIGAGTNGARGFTDLYVKVNAPSGFAANFTITNGSNISGVTIHNV